MNKPAVKYSDFLAQRNDAWMQAYERIKAAGEGAKYHANGITYETSWIHSDPRWIEFKYRADGRQQKALVRRDNALLIQLRDGVQPIAQFD